MTKDFVTIKPEYLERWDQIARIVGIDQKTYQPEVKVVSNGPGSFPFGIIFNPYRANRYGGKPEGCILCGVKDQVKADPRKSLDIYSHFPGFYITANAFPTTRGLSIAIPACHKSMHTTDDLSELPSELAPMFRFAEESGFRAFWNSEGFGASLPEHRHIQFTNFGAAYNLSGTRWGFDVAEQTPTSITQSVRTMPSFPFAHLIFDTDPEKITDFLRKIGITHGHEYEKGAVPYAIAQGEHGVLVSPAKTNIKKGPGSGDLAGHIHYTEREQFEQGNDALYQSCLERLGKVLFSKKEINLETYL